MTTRPSPSTVRRRLRGLALLTAAMLASPPSAAENPIIQTMFTADPAPLVHNGVVYLYASHDEDNAQGFTMRDWQLFTSRDMVNWTAKGTVASLKIFAWAVQDNDAWAPQVIARNGKFYLYAPVSVAGWPKNVIGVAVADRPEGPFIDVLGKPLIDKAVGYFDPTVFIDDDGQAYLYWGNPDLWYVKLNPDMISYAGPIVKVDSKPANYQEGPWFYKRNNKYYMAYASTCCPEGIGYAMSDRPTGPWVYRGDIMDHNPGSTGNHPGIIDYKGHSYLFGFNYRLNFALTPIHHERRSITVTEFSYKADGGIDMLPWWDNLGAKQLETLSPYQRVEAETMAWTSRVKRGIDRPFEWAPGVKIGKNEQVGVYVTQITDLSYIKVNGVDFGAQGAAAFTASVASGANGGTIEIHLDSPEGPLLGNLAVKSTGGWNEWRTQQTAVSGATGVHDLVLVFRGADQGPLFNLDYWQFSAR